MFGRMIVTPILQIASGADLQTSMASLLQAAEQPAIVRWIEFPNSVLLFVIVSGNPQSGAIYWLDRKTMTWYSIDFDDQEFGGYNAQQFESLVENCGFLSLIERPGLLSSGLLWTLELGKQPEARLTPTTFKVN